MIAISHKAITKNSHYLFEDGVLEFPTPVEIHVSRFGNDQTITKTGIEKYPVVDIMFENPEAFKVFINCNEPTSSPNREKNEVVVANADKYDLILTTSPYIINTTSNSVFFPYGTTWLNKTIINHPDGLGLYEPDKIDHLFASKELSLSFLCSNHTRNIEGYNLRKEIWLRAGEISPLKNFYSSTRSPMTNVIGNIDAHNYIDISLPNDNKEHLFNSAFSIAIESTREKNYFSEKLIDCLLTKTIPFYWGCPNVEEFFDPSGIITFENADDLIKKINELDFGKHYEKHIWRSVTFNHDLAKKYAISFARRVKNEIDKRLLAVDKISIELPKVLLTVGIVTLKERKEKLDVLLKHIFNHTREDVRKRMEVIINSDSGEKSVGQKRNEIIKNASGHMLCYVDDDDMLAPNYFNKIIDAIQNDSSLDSIGLGGVFYKDGQPQMVFKHANQYGGNFKDKNGVQYRPINHLNPLKTEIVKKSGGFPEKDFGEDSEYSDRVFKLNLIKNEIIIDDEPMYHYLFSPSTTRTHSE
jgi:glycosyltransferase involved in cell wall biosynthesis